MCGIGLQIHTGSITIRFPRCRTATRAIGADVIYRALSATATTVVHITVGIDTAAVVADDLATGTADPVLGRQAIGAEALASLTGGASDAGFPAATTVLRVAARVNTGSIAAGLSSGAFG